MYFFKLQLVWACVFVYVHEPIHARYSVVIRRKLVRVISWLLGIELFRIDIKCLCILSHLAVLNTYVNDHYSCTYLYA